MNYKINKYIILLASLIFSIPAIAEYDNNVIFKDGQNLILTSKRGIDLVTETDEAHVTVMPNVDANVAADKFYVGKMSLNDFLNSKNRYDMEKVVKDYIEFKSSVQLYLNYLYKFAHIDNSQVFMTNSASMVKIPVEINNKKLYNSRTVCYNPMTKTWFSSWVMNDGDLHLVKLQANTTNFVEISYPGVKTKNNIQYVNLEVNATSKNTYVRRFIYDKNNNILIAIKRYDGVWFTKDNGTTWQRLGSQSNIFQNGLDIYGIDIGADGTIVISTNRDIWKFIPGTQGDKLISGTWKQIKLIEGKELDARAIAAGSTITSYGIPEWDETTYEFMNMAPRDAVGTKTVEINNRSIFVIGISKQHQAEDDVPALWYSTDNCETFTPVDGMVGKGACGVRSIAFKNGVFVASYYSSITMEGVSNVIGKGIKYSYDGITWKDVVNPEIDSFMAASKYSPFYEISYSQGVFIVPCIWSSKKILVSVNGVDWNFINADVNIYMSAESDDEIYIAGVYNGIYKISMNREIVSPYIYSKKEIDDLIRTLTIQGRQALQ